MYGSQHLEIRPFQESDHGAIAALWADVFAYPQPRNAPDKVIRDKLAVQRDLFFVALLEGIPVGTVMGGYDGHRGWIYSLAVRADLQRHGIGTALMRRVEEELVRRGCSKINLQVVGSNAATVAFYAKLGYAVEDRISMGKVPPVETLP
jgi:ribosomal protein S18 acetylase RimI-like enzyme